jgi:hypothetical protein
MKSIDMHEINLNKTINKLKNKKIKDLIPKLAK